MAVSTQSTEDPMCEEEGWLRAWRDMGVRSDLVSWKGAALSCPRTSVQAWRASCSVGAPTQRWAGWTFEPTRPRWCGGVCVTHLGRGEDVPRGPYEASEKNAGPERTPDIGLEATLAKGGAKRP